MTCISLVILHHIFISGLRFTLKPLSIGLHQMQYELYNTLKLRRVYYYLLLRHKNLK